MSTSTTGAPKDTNTQAFYDQMWQEYGHLDAASPANFHRRRLVVSLAREYAPRASSVLDVGCGQGELLREVAGALPGCRVSGADISEQSLTDSRKRNPSYELFAMDLAAPDFAARHKERIGTFDLIICSEVLEHIPDDARAASSLRLLLAPAGVLVATVPGGTMSRFDEAIGHQRHYTVESFSRLLASSGLKVRRTLAWGFPFHSLYRTAVIVASKVAIQRPSSNATQERLERRRKRGITRALGAGYALFGKALRPLFYLNASVLGEQLLAVAVNEAP